MFCQGVYRCLRWLWFEKTSNCEWLEAALKPALHRSLVRLHYGFISGYGSVIEEQDPAIGEPDLIDKLDPNVFRVIEIEAEVMCS